MQADTTQQVTLEGTYYTDPNDGDKRVNVTLDTDKHGNPVYDSNGNLIYLVDPTNTATPIETWKIKDDSSNGVTVNTSDNNKFDFAKVDTPEKINVSDNWSTTHNNIAKGDWFQTGHQDNDKVTVDLNSSDWKDTLTDAYLIYTREATQKTETKNAERLVHYVANEVGGAALKTDVTQKVSLTGTYYVDSDGNRVNVEKTTDSQGNTVYLVKTGTAVETWAKDTTADSHDVTVATDGKATFNKVTGNDEAPKTITISSGVNKGTWSLVDDSSNKDKDVDPADTAWSTTKAKQLDDVNLIYKRLAYNVHYRDVTDKVAAGQTSDFEPTDGNDLGHESTDINGALNEAPDKTADLWDYTAAGYVLVDNPSGDALAKQTLSQDAKDQYVYLARLATPKTETKEVSRDVKYVGVVHDADDPVDGTPLTTATTVTTK